MTEEGSLKVLLMLEFRNAGDVEEPVPEVKFTWFNPSGQTTGRESELIHGESAEEMTALIEDMVELPPDDRDAFVGLARNMLEELY
jgi:hypothetical protein